MPSMHVAQAFLFFLAMRKISRRAGLYFGVFVVIVMIASVHLGYHYAVDGYVSIAVTLLIWAVAGVVAAGLSGRRGRLASAQASPFPPVTAFGNANDG